MRKETIRKVKGVKIQTLGYMVVIIAAIFLIQTIYGLVIVTKEYDQLVKLTNSYIVAQHDIQLMEDASDYLTEQARQCVVTMDKDYIVSYFEEVNEAKRREKALASIEEQMMETNPEFCEKMQEVYEQSNQLMDLEIHSMKLITIRKGYDSQELPEEIQDYVLSEDELTYTEQQLQDQAYYLVFDANYAIKKETINNELHEMMDEIISDLEQQQQVGETSLNKALLVQSIYTGLLFILILIILAFLLIFVVLPMKESVKAIEKGEYLKQRGVYEIQYLANVYNSIWELRNEKSQVLQHKAEHDALTGLWNRDIFEQFKEQLFDSGQPVALCFVDVDCFKEVNDAYGHEIGDQALQKVANLLKEHFREHDYPIRIGGDEFAIFMIGITPNDKSIIKGKFDDLNRILQIEQEGFPTMSISVGVAFSQNGYSDELYKHADVALYQTKNNGRCGCTFYNSTMKKL